MTKARALWYEAAGRPVIRTEPLPEQTDACCTIRTHFTSVSRGTERLVRLGRVPPELHAAMRCPYMGGTFAFPVKYGYSLVGEVLDGPAALAGRMVHLLHPHQDACVVRAADVYVVPPEVPARRATLASNLETALTAVWDARLTVGERVLVVGFGMVGSLVARLASWVPGVRVHVVDIDPAQAALARKLGFSAGPPDASTEPFDLAFHASSRAAGLQTALDHVGFEGRVVELSWYGTQPVSLALGGSFHSQRKQIVGTQVSTIPAFQRARWDHRRRKALVFDLLRRPSFDGHLTHEVAFDELPDYLAQERAEPEQLALVVRYAPPVG